MSAGRGSRACNGCTEPPLTNLFPRKVRELSRAASDRAAPYTAKVADFADAYLPVAAVKAIVDKTLDGTLELTFNPALRSASAGGALRGHQK
jgi:hypothetical protein